MKDYVGNPLQIRGCEEYRLQGGKGDNMRFLCIRNGLGLECWISLDRAGDLSRLSFKGDNFGFFSSCGYVSPAYYDHKGDGFLKSFTAGFFTTCGLTAVGEPCTDEGEELPLHGTLSNIPAVLGGIREDDAALTVELTVKDATFGGRILVLKRTYVFSYTENRFSVSDTVTNEGEAASPYMIMYHCNMGYPLLQEDSVVSIPNHGVTPRNAHAADSLGEALKMEKPQAGYEEMCYYYDVCEKEGLAKVSIYSPSIRKGLVMEYDKTNLPCFTQWKMMGKTNYVLGLEPGNCTPDGRNVMREKGMLQFLQGGESRTTGVSFLFTEEEIKL
ncbi:MAG: aldose 1-epimerase family protein [Clostridia bacterium]|nr:aldose 1-epimerase family protein [Clostridia bacterium]